MELLDEDQNNGNKNKRSTLIIVLAILSLVGSVVQGLYVFIQMYAAKAIIQLSEEIPGNSGGIPDDKGYAYSFNNLITIYKFRLIGDYIWIGTLVLTVIAAILFLVKRKAGMLFYAFGAVAFIISAILFFLVFGDITKLNTNQFSLFGNLVEIVCILSSLVFLFLYSMNYKKHCR